MSQTTYQEILAHINKDDFPPGYSESPMKGLSKPIVIPTRNPNVGAPFIQAYPSELSQLPNPINDQAFLALLSHLNGVMSPSVPLQLLGLAGSITGAVPVATAQIVGGAVDLTSKIAVAGVSRTRTGICMKKLNEDVFAPRRLRAQVVPLVDVAREVKWPILVSKGQEALDSDDDSQYEAMDRPKRSLRVDKRIAVLPPLDGFSDDVSTQTRRLAALQPWTSPLEVAEEKAGGKEGMLARLGEWSRERTENRTIQKRGEKLEKYEEKRREAEEKHAKRSGSLTAAAEAARRDSGLEKAATGGSYDNKRLNKLAERRQKITMKHQEKLAELEQEGNKSPGKLEKVERKRQKEVKEYQEDLQEIEAEEREIYAAAGDGNDTMKSARKQERADEKYDRKISKLETKLQRKDREEKDFRKLKFLLITNLE